MKLTQIISKYDMELRPLEDEIEDINIPRDEIFEEFLSQTLLRIPVQMDQDYHVALLYVISPDDNRMEVEEIDFLTGIKRSRSDLKTSKELFDVRKPLKEAKLHCMNLYVAENLSRRICVSDIEQYVVYQLGEKYRSNPEKYKRERIQQLIENSAAVKMKGCKRITRRKIR